MASVIIKLDDHLSLEVEGIYVPSTPDVWYLSNGDPGCPGTPSEFNIENATLVEGTVLDLLDWADNKLHIAVKQKQNGNPFPTSIWDILTEKAIETYETDISE